MQSGFVIAALIGSYGIFCVGPYLVWPNRWNILGHVQLSLFFVQYLIPLLWTDPSGFARESTIALYTEIMIVGAGAYLIALPVGFYSPRFTLTGKHIFSLSERQYGKLFRKRVLIVALLATAGLYVSFAIMGFVPILAANPFKAKYFQDEYHSGYLRAAVLFQPSFIAFLCYAPLLFVIGVKDRSPVLLFLFLAGIAAVGGLLTRGELGVPLLVGVGILVAATPGRVLFVTYLAGAILFVIIGAVANYLLSAYIAFNTGEADAQRELSVEVANGAPDVSDGLTFFEAFEEHPRFTYGAQFVGGLVPAQSLTMDWIPLAAYNPGFWAQGVVLGTDDQDTIRNTMGGGLRIAVPISGYAAFGWFGVVLMSAVCGFLTGYIVRFARNYAGRGSIEQSAMVIAMYVALRFLTVPTAITLHEMIPVLPLAWLIYPVSPLALRQPHLIVQPFDGATQFE